MKAKTKEQLMEEIESLRHEMAELERESTGCRRA
jgi:prefoldin subunit 5